MNLIAGLIGFAIALGIASLASWLFAVSFWHAFVVWVALDLYNHCTNVERHLEPERKA